MHRYATRTVAAAVLSIASCWLAPISSSADTVTIFTEDFDRLKLGPNVDEGAPGEHVWTKRPPRGWTVDRSDVAGIDDPGVGVAEWEGWSFVDPDWWVKAAGDQRRSEFERGSGVVAVADPDEWSDRGTSAELDSYSTFLSTPAISLGEVQPHSATLAFDSSWRGSNSQRAIVRVSYDGGEAVTVLLWDSGSGPNYKAAATNERITVPLKNPEGADRMVITFGLVEAGNDWWWAIDNVEVSGTPAPLSSLVSWILLPLLLVGLAWGGVLFWHRRRAAPREAPNLMEELATNPEGKDSAPPGEDRDPALVQSESVDES